MKFQETLRRLAKEREEYLEKRKNRKRLRGEGADTTEELHEARIEAESGARKKRRTEDFGAVDTTKRCPMFVEAENKKGREFATAVENAAKTPLTVTSLSPLPSAAVKKTRKPKRY